MTTTPADCIGCIVINGTPVVIKVGCPVHDPERNTTDSDLEPEQQRWLTLNGHPDIEAWARDSGYTYSEVSCEWTAIDGGPFAEAVDIYGALDGAIEAQSCDYEVTVANIFHATDQADAIEQMVTWLVDNAGSAGYRWERLDTTILNGEELPHETGFLDADDLTSLVTSTVVTS